MHSKLCSRFKVYGRPLHVPANKKHKTRRRDANQKKRPPRRCGRQQREKDGVKKRCHSPSHCPAPLHHTQRFPPMFGADGFAQENSSRGPLTAETKPQKRASNEQLLVVLRNT